MSLDLQCNTQIPYTGDGSTTTFKIDFDIYNEAHVYVAWWSGTANEWVTRPSNDLDFGYTVDEGTNESFVIFNQAPENGQRILIYRLTPVDQMRVDFEPGRPIKAQDLDDNFNQLADAIEDTRCVVEGFLDDNLNPDDIYWKKAGETLYSGHAWEASDCYIASTAALENRIRALITISDTAPPTPNYPGQLWWNSNIADLFIYYYDGNSYQWVSANNSIGDAPSNGIIHGRRDKEWVEINSASLVGTLEAVTNNGNFTGENNILVGSRNDPTITLTAADGSAAFDGDVTVGSTATNGEFIRLRTGANTDINLRSNDENSPTFWQYYNGTDPTNLTYIVRSSGMVDIGGSLTLNTNLNLSTPNIRLNPNGSTNFKGDMQISAGTNGFNFYADSGTMVITNENTSGNQAVAFSIYDGTSTNGVLNYPVTIRTNGDATFAGNVWNYTTGAAQIGKGFSLVTTDGGTNPSRNFGFIRVDNVSCGIGLDVNNLGIKFIGNLSDTNVDVDVPGDATFGGRVECTYVYTNTPSGSFNTFLNKGDDDALNTVIADSGGSQKIKFYNNGNAEFAGPVTANSGIGSKLIDLNWRKGQSGSVLRIFPGANGDDPTKPVIDLKNDGTAEFLSGTFKIEKYSYPTNVPGGGSITSKISGGYIQLFCPENHEDPNVEDLWSSVQIFNGSGQIKTTLFADGDATFGGTVTVNGTRPLVLALEPDNNDYYVSTTDSEGIETRVYNGPTLDVKAVIQELQQRVADRDAVIADFTARLAALEADHATLMNGGNNNGY